MKKILTLLSLMIAAALYSQTDTEVYLFDLDIEGDKVELSNPKNISNNQGYDNQPSFFDKDKVLFAATREEQTDVLLFDIVNGSAKTWLTDTPTGGEYSPLKIPGKNAFSAIRLDLDGLQRLYEYDVKTGASKVLLEGLKVGYHVWFNKHIIVCTVLKENRMDLVVSNLKDNTNYTVQKNVGRSLHKIPDTETISYISKESGHWAIKSLDPISGSTFKIIDTYGKTEDMCWLPNGSILAGAGKALVYAQPENGLEWKQLTYFPHEEIHSISRIVANTDGTRLAFVSEISPRTIVQKQLDAYNAKDIDRFLATFSDDIELFDYPSKSVGKGKAKMREMYQGFFAKTPDLNCELKNRIVLGNKVIDEEYITANGSNFSAVAIYEVKNGKIAKVTFIR
ncbi:hypothetical protein MTsPCn5_01630 [Croceitalea sp. MTPC5]|uniref:nuclear transport factor 2 family protein n=1 Tax=Croceitalea sp. MTPC5 TaxID=3056565 RepID=UPI002B3CDD20|nr:hypothetical protein MTsPCn5_01630 [Croceitalea sp. MTPC5]